MVQTTICTPIPVYIITEKVYHKVGWGYVTINGMNIGADAYQITRKIVSSCVVQDLFLDGKLVEGSPTPWQTIKYLLGIEEATTKPRPNTKNLHQLVYSGYKTNIKYVHEETGPMNLPGLFKFGVDPIPDITLYGNEKVNFHSVGGNDVLTAVAIYDKHNGLQVLPPERQKELIKELTVAVANYIAR